MHKNQIQYDYETPGMNRSTFSCHAEPFAKLHSGESIEFDSNDNWLGNFKEDGAIDPDILQYTNDHIGVATGPFVIEEAQPGDWLKVSIDKVEPYNVGASAIGKTVCLCQQRFGETQVRLADIEDGYVIINDQVKIPYRPMIGTIGTTPADYEPRIKMEGFWGGNMDVPRVGPGAEIWLPVFVEGAYLYAGDCHAMQGDGECINPFEVGAHLGLTFEVVKQEGVDARRRLPRLITEETIEVIGTGNDYISAVQPAVEQMIDWLKEDYGFNEEDAAFFCGCVGDGRPGGAVNYQFTVAYAIERHYLPPKK